MSYASLTKTLPAVFSQPTGLAALASFGIHGLLLIVLPFLPLDSQSRENQSSRTVGVVELTPDELSRLPQAKQPGVASQPSVLPPLPQPPNLNSLPPDTTTPPSVLPPLPPLPPPPLTFNPVPPSSSSIYKPPIGAAQPLPVPLTPPGVNSRSFNPEINLEKPPTPAPSQTYKLPQSSPPNLKPAPFSPPDTSPAAVPNQNNNQPQNQGANQGTRPPFAPSRPEKLPDSTIQQLLARRNQLRVQPNDSFSRSLSAAAAEREARLQNRLKNPTSENSETARANPQLNPPPPASRLGKLPESTIKQLLARRNQLRVQPTPNYPGTSTATAERIEQLNKWSQRQYRVQENYPNAVQAKPVYEAINCQRELQGVAVVGVVVNPEGKIISGPDIIYTKGTPGIEQAAQNYVKAYQFPRNNKLINQPFNLQFQYDPSKCSASNR